MDDYYRDLSKYDYADRGGKEPPAAELRFEEIADVLQHFIPDPKSRIFEIGCASGQLLKVLQTRGFANVLGSDPSPGCVRAAQEIYGVPALVSTVFTAPQPAERFDFLILIGVMEHIRDLDRTVDQFHLLLRNGGRAYLEVPDASRYVPRVDAPFQEFSVEHVNFFSARSLTNLMHARGFRELATGLVVRPQNEITCPAVYGIYERSSEPLSTERDNDTEAGLRAYIEGCRAEDVRIRLRIEQALSPGERMIVWGVGTHTLRLLATGGLDLSKIAFFVDSNPKYQNQDLHGLRVIAPLELKGRQEPILISSRGFQREIQNQIREELGLTNPLILLYEEL
jgi:SAM-dependent methyltransferase